LAFTQIISWQPVKAIACYIRKRLLGVYTNAYQLSDLRARWTYSRVCYSTLFHISGASGQSSASVLL